MFGFGMKDGIVRKMLRLSQSKTGVVKGIFNSVKRDWIHNTSEAELAKLLYPASVLDQETRLGPKYMQEPEVNFLSSGLTPQYASENSVMDKGT